MRVIVQGRLKQRSYEDREGVKRTVYELDVEEVGASLRNATAKVTKTSGGGAQRSQPQAGGQGTDDQWATAPGGDEPPF
jgi:single-strand DNA-binding protein